MSYKNCIFLAHKQSGEFILFTVLDKTNLEDFTTEFAKDFYFKTATDNINTYAKARIEDFCSLAV